METNNEFLTWKEGDEDNLRYERKYVITEVPINEILHMIKTNPAVFSEVFYERQVNNIYFDTVNKDSYNDNVSGIAKRMKIRIRWYGKTSNTIDNSIEKPVLEIKMKMGFLGKKHSFKMPAFTFPCSEEEIKKVLSEADFPNWLHKLLVFYSPSLLNSYKRRYFVSADKKFRITLDWNMKFNTFGSQSTSILEHDKHVVEIKYSAKDSDCAHYVTEHFPLRYVAHSKYVKGLSILQN